MVDTHLDKAFHDTMAEVEGVPQYVITTAWLQVKDTWADYRKSVKLLLSALDPYPWRWPRWEQYTAAERAEALQERIQDWVDTTAADLLSISSATTLKDMCRQDGIQLKGKATKQMMVEALLASWGPVKCSAYVAKEREADLSKFSNPDRLEVCGSLVRSIGIRARGADRMRQLTEMTGSLPYWEFIWREETSCSPTTQQACKRLNGQILHFTQALRAFPIFSCPAPECHCRIHARPRGA